MAFQFDGTVQSGTPQWQVVEREELATAQAQPPSPPESPQQPEKAGRRGRRAVFALLGLALLTSGGMMLSHWLKDDDDLQQPVELASLSLTATVQDADGVSPDTQFLLSSSTPLSKSDVAALLHTEPELEFTVQKGESVVDPDGTQLSQLVLTPKEQLRGNTVYNLVFSQGDEQRSFAFQSKAAFALRHTMPQNSNVGVDSGIELGFAGGNPVDLEKAVTITPALEGHFEHVRDSYVYIHGGMEYDTWYTVTVSGELQSEGGALLGEDVSFSFRTTPYRENELYTPWRDSQCSTVLPDRVPAILCYPMSEVYDLEYDVTVYRFHDQSGYLEAMRTLYEYEKQMGANTCTFSTEQASPILTFTDSLKRTQSGRACLALPDTLEKGYYLIKADCEQSSCSMEQLVQVSDVAVYLAAGDGRLALWANNAATGEPLAGVTVMQDGYSKGVTDQNGLLMLETPDTDTREEFSYLSIDVGTTPYLLDSMAQPEREQLSAQRKYYTAFYTDRSVYLPNDTLNFWGVVQPRIGSVSPKKVTAMLCTWNPFDNSDFPYSVLHSSELTLEEMGTFSGVFELEDMAFGYYSLVLDIEGEKLFLDGVTVTEYKKPIYLLEVSSNAPVYDIKEPIHMTVEASFYDGTPAVGLQLLAEYYHPGATYQSVTMEPTDRSGKTSLSISLTDDDTDWRPRYQAVSFSNLQAEDAYLRTSESVVVLPRDLMLETESSRDGWSLTLLLHDIRQQAFEDGDTTALWDYDALRGDPAEGTLTCTVRRLTWHRRLEETRYDYIEKKNINVYSYYTTEEVLDTLTLEAQNGQATLDLSGYELGEDSYFEVEAEVRDSEGRLIRETASLHPVVIDLVSSNGGGYDVYQLRSEKTDFVPGETVEFSLVQNGNLVAENAGRVLLLPVTDNLTEGVVQQTGDISLRFEQQHIPNVRLYGAYFDGRDIYELFPEELTYRCSERELQVEVTPDAGRYAPGDEVTLEISVTDAQGQPVQAQLLVSVVDEAALAVYDDPVSLLEELFEPLYDADIRTFVSYDGKADEGGGGGGGGSELVRDDFSDNPAFETLSTSRQGKAALTFSLADSVTSWRITTLAVSEQAAAGQNVQNVETGLPFFVNLLSSSQYVEGDDVSICLRAFGEQLSQGEQVAFAAELTAKGETSGITKSGSGTFGEYVTLSFGKQEAGSYTLRVSGKSASHSDAMEVQLEVVESTVESPVLRELSPDQMGDIEPARYPVTVSICDDQSALYYAALSELAGTQGARMERRVARSAAVELLGELAPELAGTLPQAEALSPLYDGAFPLPTMMQDVLLTAKIAMAAPELVGDGLENYFLSALSDEDCSADDAAAAYLGLAAMKQPVLRDVRALLAWEPEQGSNVQMLTDRQQMLLTAALAAIGDDDGAKAAYDAFIAPKLVSEEGLMWADGEEQADRVENTALALLTASVVAKDDAQAMMRYLLQNPSEQVLTCLEQLFYAKNNKPAAQEPLQVTVSMDGGGQTLSLGRRGIVTLQLSKQQFESFSVGPAQQDTDETSGQAAPDPTLFVSYLGGADQRPGQESGAVTLSKTIEPVEGDDITQSSLLKVTIRASFEGEIPKGGYLVSDVICSGMRFANMPVSYDYYSRQTGWYLMSQDGQHLTFSAWYGEDGENSPEEEIVYYVRAVLPGTFVSEAPVLTHEGSSLWGTAEKGLVTIEP